MAVEKKKPEAPLSDKKKALETAISQIEKNFGKGTVMRLGDRPEMNVEAIPTGSLALDAALGIGGVPKGRIIEIYGPESSGKTTLALHIVAQAQKRGGEVAFVDAEHPQYNRRNPKRELFRNQAADSCQQKQRTQRQNRDFRGAGSLFLVFLRLLCVSNGAQLRNPAAVLLLFR